MNRRSFLKQVAATAAVGAVAPKLLADPVKYTMGVDWAMGVDRAVSASRIVYHGTVYDLALDVQEWKWVAVATLKPRVRFRG